MVTSTGSSISAGKIVPVIMAGGIGARLWPLSREDKPKQFLNPLAGSTLLQRTVERLLGDENSLGIQNIVVVTNADFAEQTRGQLARFDGIEFDYIFEPCIRNTAPALAAATVVIEEKYPGSVIAMLAADHHVVREAEFRNALKLSCEVAGNDKAIVTFGITPDRPETGYGYIKYDPSEGAVCKVEAFVEKPDVETAAAWVSSGNYLWNSGKFVFPASTMANAFQRQQPEMLASVQDAINKAKRHDDGLYLDPVAFGACASISIDYAIMEGAENLKVVPADIGWFDVGAWEQISNIAELDGSASKGHPLVSQLESKGTFVLPSDRHIVTIGADNLVVVDTQDALLIADRSKTQEVKKVYEAFKNQKSPVIFSSFEALSPMAQAKFNHDRVNKWLLEKALPFWLANAADQEQGGIVESFTREGEPMLDEPRRVRVLARQIYSFAFATCMGWRKDTTEFLNENFSYMVKHAWRDEGGGWVSKLTADGSHFDDSVTAYDQSFALLAFAWLYKATRDKPVLAQVDKTIAFVDANLNGQGTNGLETEWRLMPPLETKKMQMALNENMLAEKSSVVEGEALDSFKHSNPHMHMLEAFLALYSATGDRAYLSRASNIVELFKDKIFDHEHSLILELFDQDMSPIDARHGQWIEPGHMYEWAHLLATYEQLSGEKLFSYSRRMIATAETYGRSAESGLVLDRLDPNLNVVENTSRLWPQLERLRALVRLEKGGVGSFETEIERLVDKILSTYLSDIEVGLWDDCVDREGKRISQTVPQSTFYHLITAFAEYLSLTDKQLPVDPRP